MRAMSSPTSLFDSAHRMRLWPSDMQTRPDGRDPEVEVARGGSTNKGELNVNARAASVKAPRLPTRGGPGRLAREDGVDGRDDVEEVVGFGEVGGGAGFERLIAVAAERPGREEEDGRPRSHLAQALAELDGGAVD